MAEEKKREHPSYGMIRFSRVRGGNPALIAGIEKNNAETEELRKTVSELNGQVAELTKALQDLSERIRWSR